jgi:hypothetical protein
VAPLISADVGGIVAEIAKDFVSAATPPRRDERRIQARETASALRLMRVVTKSEIFQFKL